ncbi:MAG: hypothetical protein ABMA64_07765 [Myxococcota bacterium]
MSEVSPEIFAAWRAPRFGATNPARHDNPLWASLVHDRINAYQVNARYGHGRVWGAAPTWCFDRFGQTTTALPDGRTLYIGGEHEDYYDPDFYIYNDVVEVSAAGEVAIYGYPREVFPPTDFHTATLDGGAIWIVGSLGYAGQRVYGTTQVCRLELATMAITRLETTGDGPGWLHRHEADLVDGAIVVRGGTVERAEAEHPEENIDEWALDLASLTWTRRTRREWQRWSVQAPEGARSLLWELRQLLWHVEYPRFPSPVDYAETLRTALGREPVLEPLQTLYDFDGAVACERGEDDDYNLFRVEVDGVIVRFVEESHRIAVMVEGRLAEPRLRALQQQVLARVGALHAVAWELVG